MNAIRWIILTTFTFGLLTLASVATGQSVQGAAAGYARDNRGSAGTYAKAELNKQADAVLDFKTPPTNARGEDAIAYAYANDEGRVYAGLRTGQSLPAPFMSRGVVGTSLVDFISKVYTKTSETTSPTFTVTPSWLEIYWALEYHEASMVFSVDVCRPDEELLECQEQGRLEAVLSGANGTVATHTYDLIHELVDRMPKGSWAPTVYDCSHCADADGNPIPMSQWSVGGARYDFPEHTGEIDLSSFAVGEQFVVRYYLYTEGIVPTGPESGVTSFIGDPLDVDSGISFDPGPGVSLADPQPQINTQSCNSAINESTPDARFTLLPDGSAHDTLTGLTWQRCPYGYVFDAGASPGSGDDQCLPSAATQFSWASALAAASQAGSWRLPNVKELSSIVELACFRPAMNTGVFPATDADSYWTNTPSDFDFAWAIDFYRGQPQTISQAFENAVRLVRESGSDTGDLLFYDDFEIQSAAIAN